MSRTADKGEPTFAHPREPSIRQTALKRSIRICCRRATLQARAGTGTDRGTRNKHSLVLRFSARGGRGRTRYGQTTQKFGHLDGCCCGCCKLVNRKIKRCPFHRSGRRETDFRARSFLVFLSRVLIVGSRYNEKKNIASAEVVLLNILHQS